MATTATTRIRYAAAGPSPRGGARRAIRSVSIAFALLAVAALPAWSATDFTQDPNIVSWWFLEESSGTRFDGSANQNDLTDNNTVGSSTDAMEGSASADFERDNGNENLSIPDNASLSITGNLTIVAWVKLESLPSVNGDEQGIAGKGGGAGERAYSFYIDDANNNLRVRLSSDGTASTTAEGATALAANTWHHAALVYDGTAIRLYLNGVLDANGTANPKAYTAGIVDNTEPFRIGARSDQANDFDGLIDEVAIFDRALLATEINEIFTNGLTGPTLPTITGIDPTTGVKESTLTLTVTGTNLAGATALTFLNGGTADPDITATNLSVDPTGTTLTASVTIASAAALGPRVVTVTTPAGTSSDIASAANTFTVLGKLILTPDPLTVTEGASAQLTVSVLDPAPAGGIEITLESAGPTIATVTSPVTIAEGGTSTTATVTGVSLGGTNVTATAVGFGAAQGVIDVQAFQGGPPTTFEITEPADGATVPEGTLVVRGTVEAGGEEVGVTVNGVLASVQGNTFAALVPVTPDTTSLTATATTASGGTASESIAITVAAPPTSTVTLLVSPSSGVAPLTVAFSLLGGPVPTNIDLDFDGDGTVDFSGPSLEGQTFTYTQAGLFFPTVTVTDAQGNQFTGSTLVRVDDQVALDALLQAKWTGMRDSLRAGDIPGALTRIAFRSRSRYDEAFRAIAAQLPNIDTILTNVTLVEVRNEVATYQATRTDAGVDKVFDVRFVIDEDGIWRIEAF